MEKRILEYLAELETSGDTNYKHLIKYADIESLPYWIEKRNSFFDLEIFIPNKDYLGILNVHPNGNFVGEDKFNEIKDLITLFSEDYFCFLTDFLTINLLNGVLLKFPKKIKWNEFSNNQIFFGEGFFFTGIPDYFWLGEKWLRQVFAYESDIYIPKYKKTIDFPAELIIVHQNNFEKIKEIYAPKYGIINPILSHAKFLETIFEVEYKYLLADNIYITEGSLNFLKDQIFNNDGNVSNMLI